MINMRYLAIVGLLFLSSCDYPPCDYHIHYNASLGRYYVWQCGLVGSIDQNFATEAEAVERIKELRKDISRRDRYIRVPL